MNKNNVIHSARTQKLYVSRLLLYWFFRSDSLLNSTIYHTERRRWCPSSGKRWAFVEHRWNDDINVKILNSCWLSAWFEWDDNRMWVLFWPAVIVCCCGLKRNIHSWSYHDCTWCCPRPMKESLMSMNSKYSSAHIHTRLYARAHAWCANDTYK